MMTLGPVIIADFFPHLHSRKCTFRLPFSPAVRPEGFLSALPAGPDLPRPIGSLAVRCNIGWCRGIMGRQGLSRSTRKVTPSECPPGCPESP
jgi:hypothetical protein